MIGLLKKLIVLGRIFSGGAAISCNVNVSQIEANYFYGPTWSNIEAKENCTEVAEGRFNVID